MPQLNIYLIVCLLLSNAITGILWRVAVSDLTELELRGRVAQERADSVVKQQQQVTEDTTNGWKAALDSVRADYARRLRDAGAGQMPRLPDPARRLDAIPADALPVAAECAETTLQLENLQGWILRQQKIH